MREYWVYELVAGRWRYIGMTSNLQRRLVAHRTIIAKHPEKPRTSNWHPALLEYPDPQSWEMQLLSGPFETKDEAISEEERLQREDWDNPGRVWDKCGHMPSAEHKAKLRDAKLGKTSPRKGVKLSEDTKEKLRNRIFSIETRQKMKESAKLRHAKNREAAKARID